jgi:DNA-binding response OmpR family regulator
MLPKLEGLSVLERLREAGKTTHVLLLTARDCVAERVRGLKLGADDYLIKPFALEELLARVEALCRRAYGSKQNRLVVGDLELDTAAKRIWRAGQPLKLRPREYQLLEYMVRRQGEVLTQREIEEHLYNEEVQPVSNVIESILSSLRRKLSEVNPAPLIHTRRGFGYVLDSQPS